MTKLLTQQFKLLPDNAVELPYLDASPSLVARSWDKDVPLIALIGGGETAPWSRWSIIAPATGKRLTLDGPDAMAQLKDNLETGSDTLLPNWIGYLGYELGHIIEPTAAGSKQNMWPLVDLFWCNEALVHDSETNTWWSIGDLEPPDLCIEFSTELVMRQIHDEAGNTAFKESVEKVVDYIHAGDIFQANITRRFHAQVEGNIRDAALSTLGDPGGFFGAWLEFPDDHRYLMSMSPELFLKLDGQTRSVITRPMKGTRPDYDDPANLMQSEKDAAELHMIVDLMRNDLGRVCQYGSMEVVDSRLIEKHPTVWQCVGEVKGQLRDTVTISDLIEATFPAGSITGAPKIRAMQIINDLERSPREAYCGAIGVLGPTSILSVAIRTAMFSGTCDPHHFKGNMEYSTGCGIVAESNAEDELRESEVKTHILSTFGKSPSA
ncbi:MAG: anthranilate synthase component I family protein [Planctomycetota bacterium]|nr:anthranilate synthase component I family protein [Planctomycetota bacterium]